MNDTNNTPAVAAVCAALAAPPFALRSGEKPRAHQAARQAIGQRCPTCGDRLTASSARWARIVPLVHLPPLGIGDTDRIVLCTGCVARRGAGDLLVLRPPAELLERRAALLHQAQHHLTSRLSRAAILRVLDARIAHPRTALVAAHDAATGDVVLGWSALSGDPDTLAGFLVRLRFQSGARAVHASDSMSVWRLPSSVSLSAMWMLIEHGALIRCVGTQPPAIDDDWRACWPLRVDSIARQLDRRDPETGWAIGAPGPVLSVMPDSIRRRDAKRAASAARDRAASVTDARQRAASSDPLVRFATMGDLLDLGVLPGAVGANA